jgi:hypothetical protein
LLRDGHHVPLLTLLPWCRLDREYAIGEILLRPYAIGNDLPGLDETARRFVETIVGLYRDIEGKTFGHPSIAVWKGRAALHDLSESEEETLGKMVTVACFASLARRDLASAGGHYTNSTRFTSYRTRFREPGDFAALSFRRREGRRRDGRSLSGLRFTCPMEASGQSDFSIDEPLAQAVVRFREQSTEAEWNRLLNALTWFNFGNSDSEAVSSHMEFVAHVSAIQELLCAGNREREFAQVITPELPPSSELLAAHSARDKGFWGNSSKPLRYEWARELYRMRNQYAHGQVVAHRQNGWRDDEHLTLAAIAFPLLVKRHLERHGCYSLDVPARAAVRGFERLLNTNFLEGADPASEDQWHPWNRIIASECLGIASEVNAENNATTSTPPTGEGQ